MPSFEAAFRALGAVSLLETGAGRVQRVRTQCLAGGPPPLLSPLELAEGRRAGRVARATRHRQLPAATELSRRPALTMPALRRPRRRLGGESLGAVLMALAASCGTPAAHLGHRATSAPSRVHELVAACQGVHVHGQATVARTGDVARGLSDTADDLRSKAKSKSVRLSAEGRTGPATVEWFGGELNQVWAIPDCHAIER